MIDDVILNKKESVERCVSQIRAYYTQTSLLPFDEDHLRQDAIAIEHRLDDLVALTNRILEVP